MAEFGGGGVLGGLGGIVAGIASAIRAFAGITAQQLLNYLTSLRTHLLELSQGIYKGLKETAKALARSVLALARGFRDGIRAFVSWASRHLAALHSWLKDKLGPVLRFIEKVRKRIADIYAKYVRPVLDVIDFIRQLNRILEAFHIHVLSSLDATLAEIERRINEPFQWVTQQINRIDNFLDRVIGLNGLYQRFTMLASLRRYAPAWFSIFWGEQVTRAPGRDNTERGGRQYPPHDSERDKIVLREYFETGGGDAAGLINELRITFRQVATGTVPPEPEGAEL